MKQLESQQQTALFKLIHLRAKTCAKWNAIYSIPNGGKRDAAVGAKMKAEGQKAGVWDICVPIPAGCYLGMFIEMKAGKNKLSTSQISFRDNLVSACYDPFAENPKSWKFEVCYSAKEAYETIENYFKGV